MKSQKAQSALEFLTTYGWAFLVILIMISALAYFGVLNPPIQDKCIFDAGFDCPEVVFNADGNAQFVIVNAKGVALSNVAIGLASAQNTNCGAAVGDDGVTGETANWAPGEEFTMTIDCDGLGDDQQTLGEGERPLFNVNMSYTTAGGSLTQKAKGTVSGTAK